MAKTLSMAQPCTIRFTRLYKTNGRSPVRASFILPPFTRCFKVQAAQKGVFLPTSVEKVVPRTHSPEEVDLAISSNPPLTHSRLLLPLRARPYAPSSSPPTTSRPTPLISTRSKPPGHGRHALRLHLHRNALRLRPQRRRPLAPPVPQEPASADAHLRPI